MQQWDLSAFATKNSTILLYATFAQHKAGVNSEMIKALGFIVRPFKQGVLFFPINVSWERESPTEMGQIEEQIRRREKLELSATPVRRAADSSGRP